MKRFVESTKWDDPWFRKLPPEAKLFWDWICCKCDQAGVIDPDYDLASFQTGSKITSKVLNHFKDRIDTLPSGKLHILKFVHFQYGKLSPSCKPHTPVFAAIARHGLVLDENSQFQRLSKGITYPINGYHGSLKEEEEEEEPEKDEEKDEEKYPEKYSAFDKFWQAYPKKKSKGDAEKAWGKLKLDSLLPQILASLESLKKDRDWIKDGGQFIPHPASWLNSKGWQDEVNEANPKKDLNDWFIPIVPQPQPETVTNDETDYEF